MPLFMKVVYRWSPVIDIKNASPLLWACCIFSLLPNYPLCMARDSEFIHCGESRIGPEVDPRLGCHCCLTSITLQALPIPSFAA